MAYRYLVIHLQVGDRRGGVHWRVQPDGRGGAHAQDFASGDAPWRTQRAQHRRHAEHRLHGNDGVLWTRVGPGCRNRGAHAVRPGLQDDVGWGVSSNTPPGHVCTRTVNQRMFLRAFSQCMVFCKVYYISQKFFQISLFLRKQSHETEGYRYFSLYFSFGSFPIMGDINFFLLKGHLAIKKTPANTYWYRRLVYRGTCQVWDNFQMSGLMLTAHFGKLKSSLHWPGI